MTTIKLAPVIRDEPIYLNVGVPAPVQSGTPGKKWRPYHDEHRAALHALMGSLGWALVPEMSRLAENDGRGALYVFKTYSVAYREGDWPAPLKAYVRANFVDVANAMELAIKKALGLIDSGEMPAQLVAVRPLVAAAGELAKAADEVRYIDGEEYWKHGDR